METEILVQRAGDRLSVESSVIALNNEYADAIFRQAAQNLLDVSKWHKLPCSLLSALKLLDESGNEIDRHVQQNDYFMVNPTAGESEWVRIEKIQHTRNTEQSTESVLICARPCQHPRYQEGLLDSRGPSNTFMVARSGLHITVSVWGKNKLQGQTVIPNLYDVRESRPDSTVGAIPGIARVQWRSLVNGILSTWKE